MFDVLKRQRVTKYHKPNHYHRVAWAGIYISLFALGVWFGWYI